MSTYESFNKLKYLLTHKIDTLDHAKFVTGYLRKFRSELPTAYNDFNAIQYEELVAIIISSYKIILPFVSLLDESIGYILSILEVKENRERIVIQIVDEGGLILCLSAMKRYSHDQNICKKCVDLLSMSIELIVEDYRLNDGVILVHPTVFQPECLPKKSPDEIINLLILHGAASVLPRLLVTFVSASKELSILAITKILRFLILYATPATSGIISQRIATLDNWCSVQALLNVLRNFTSQAAVDAAALLLCMVAESDDVASQLQPAGGWDDISSTVAGNLDALRARLTKRCILRTQQRISHLLQRDEQRTSLADPALEVMQAALANLLMNTDKNDLELRLVNSNRDDDVLSTVRSSYSMHSSCSINHIPNGTVGTSGTSLVHTSSGSTGSLSAGGNGGGETEALLSLSDPDVANDGLLYSGQQQLSYWLPSPVKPMPTTSITKTLPPLKSRLKNSPLGDLDSIIKTRAATRRVNGPIVRSRLYAPKPNSFTSKYPSDDMYQELLNRPSTSSTSVPWIKKSNSKSKCSKGIEQKDTLQAQVEVMIESLQLEVDTIVEAELLFGSYVGGDTEDVSTTVRMTDEGRVKGIDAGNLGETKSVPLEDESDFHKRLLSMILHVSSRPKDNYHISNDTCKDEKDLSEVEI